MSTRPVAVRLLLAVSLCRGRFAAYEQLLLRDDVADDVLLQLHRVCLFLRKCDTARAEKALHKIIGQQKQNVFRLMAIRLTVVILAREGRSAKVPKALKIGLDNACKLDAVLSADNDKWHTPYKRNNSTPATSGGAGDVDDGAGDVGQVLRGVLRIPTLLPSRERPATVQRPSVIVCTSSPPPPRSAATPLPPPPPASSSPSSSSSRAQSPTASTPAVASVFDGVHLLLHPRAAVRRAHFELCVIAARTHVHRSEYAQAAAAYKRALVWSLRPRRNRRNSGVPDGGGNGGGGGGGGGGMDVSVLHTLVGCLRSPAVAGTDRDEGSNDGGDGSHEQQSTNGHADTTTTAAEAATATSVASTTPASPSLTTPIHEQQVLCELLCLLLVHGDATDDAAAVVRTLAKDALPPAIAQTVLGGDGGGAVQAAGMGSSAVHGQKVMDVELLDAFTVALLVCLAHSCTGDEPGDGVQRARTRALCWELCCATLLHQAGVAHSTPLQATETPNTGTRAHGTSANGQPQPTKRAKRQQHGPVHGQGAGTAAATWPSAVVLPLLEHVVVSWAVDLVESGDAKQAVFHLQRAGLYLCSRGTIPPLFASALGLSQVAGKSLCTFSSVVSAVLMPHFFLVNSCLRSTAAATAVLDDADISFQIHSYNDLRLWPQLMRKSATWFKIDPHWMPPEFCRSQERVTNTTDGCFVLNHDRPSGRRTTYNTTDDLLSFFTSPLVKSYFSSGPEKHVALCFKWDNAVGLCSDFPAAKHWRALADAFFDRATRVIREHGLNVTFVLDGAGTPTKRSCLNNRWTPLVATWIVGRDPDSALTSNATSNGDYRYQVNNMPAGNPVAANLQTLRAKDYGKFLNTSYPFLFWEPAAQQDIVDVVSAYKQGPITRAGLRFATNIDPVQVSLYAASTSTSATTETRTALGVKDNVAATQTTWPRTASRPAYAFGARSDRVASNTSQVWTAHGHAIVLAPSSLEASAVSSPEAAAASAGTTPKGTTTDKLTYYWTATNGSLVPLPLMAGRTLLSVSVDPSDHSRVLLACTDTLVMYTLGEAGGVAAKNGTVVNWPVTGHVAGFAPIQSNATAAAATATAAAATATATTATMTSTASAAALSGVVTYHDNGHADRTRTGDGDDVQGDQRLCFAVVRVSRYSSADSPTTAITSKACTPQTVAAARVATVAVTGADAARLCSHTNDVLVLASANVSTTHVSLLAACLDTSTNTTTMLFNTQTFATGTYPSLDLTVHNSTAYMALVVQDAFCWNTETHNKQPYPGACDNEPTPTQFALSYTVSSVTDLWRRVQAYAGSTVATPCTYASADPSQQQQLSTFVHGTFGAGKHPDVSVTVAGARDGLATSEPVLRLQTAQMTLTHSDPISSALSECGAPIVGATTVVRDDEQELSDALLHTWLL
ncbi:hypothetical protein PTSG_04617 [Salpingoeca rosetta]|uniref:Uncharacterized protein n=1 Tax=Salpingoeca rosetta (strain ATCC 50818 / BSB-021) TaxID=946362 RepID=F2U7Y2_SALR5|nr:uncharacterized protein PTSG_04617 [Salpingoeca rosetta]EGD72887.1 hypothetical protein PTSG_04617 [Salpingoeca rosetta]|eukprot:XP_004994709.1 hypothetical protein PTSG_04617 [Salpingoeca rosetta]